MKQESTMESSLSFLDETNSSIDISEDHSLKIPNSSSILETLDSQDTELMSNESPCKLSRHGDVVDDDRFLSNEKGEDYENFRLENDSNHYHSPLSTDDNDYYSSPQKFTSHIHHDTEEEEELSQDEYEECEEVLSDVEDDMITTDDILNSYEEYEKEQDEFNREMNRTKIAFAAYRNAVLHLVHHQDYQQKRPAEGNHDTQDMNDDQRMATLEETAKSIIETKAKACMDAVLVANEFVERRAARRERSKLLTETIGGKANLFAELLKRSNQEKIATDSNEKTCNGFKSKNFRRSRTLGRHVDCIISTFKFEFRRDENDISIDLEEGHSPARYKTSAWIGNMVEWRKQRNEYKESCFRKCSCPDCLNDLKTLKNEKYQE
jgi:hypothetical protein